MLSWKGSQGNQTKCPSWRNKSWILLLTSPKSAKMRVSAEISNHSKLAKPLEFLPFPWFSVNFDVHRLEESKVLSQSLPALLWKVVHSWSKSCCAPWMTCLLLAQVIMSLSVSSWEADKACGVPEKTFFSLHFHICFISWPSLAWESEKGRHPFRKTKHNTTQHSSK